MFATNERHIPQAWRAGRILLYRNLPYEVAKELRAFVVALLFQMLSQARERRKRDWRADEQHRFALQSTKNDLVWRPDALDVGRNVCDVEVARINPTYIHVKRGPEMVSAAGPCFGAVLRRIKTPLGTDPSGRLILSSILFYAVYLRLEPRIEYGNPELLKKLADTVAPAKLLLSLS